MWYSCFCCRRWKRCIFLAFMISLFNPFSSKKRKSHCIDGCNQSVNVNNCKCKYTERWCRKNAQESQNKPDKLQNAKTYLGIRYLYSEVVQRMALKLFRCIRQKMSLNYLRTHLNAYCSPFFCLFNAIFKSKPPRCVFYVARKLFRKIFLGNKKPKSN